MNLKEQLKQLIESIKNIDLNSDYTWENILKNIDSSSVWFNLTKDQIKSLDYVFYKLNENIRNTLLNNDIVLPQWEIIDLPNIAWPDFVLKVKEIFDLNKDRFGNIKQFSDSVVWLLNWSEIWYIKNFGVQWVFINIFVSEDFFSDILKNVVELDKNYWINDFMSWQKAIVEYSSPNMAKQMTVGHFRTTIIWQILSNLVQKSGANLCKWNYLGDWGTPYGKNIFALIYFSTLNLDSLTDEQRTKYQWFVWEDLFDKLNQNPISTLEFLYSSFKEIADDTKEDKARAYFKLLEQWHPDVIKLWTIIREYSKIDFQNVYERLWVSFDTDLWESYTWFMVDEIVSDIEKSWYLLFNDWAYLVKFVKNWSDYIPVKSDEISDEKDLSVMLIKKSDGTTLYATRDMVNLKFRWEILWANKLYYCVGNEQTLNFQLLFALADKLGYISKDNCFHVWNWLFLIWWEKMSSRKWNVHRMAELLDLVKEKITEDFGNSDQILAEKLTISAVIFNEIKNDRSKDIEFNIENMTKINGDTWVYLQYSRARLNSLLEKININWELRVENWDFSTEEKELIKLVSIFVLLIKRSVNLTKPHVLAQYLLNICQKFNSWYANSPKIVDLSEEAKLIKYALLSSLKIVLDNWFELLNLPVVERM